MKEFAVIGLGRFGSSVAHALTQMGKSVLAIDLNEAKVQAMSDVVTHAVQADAADPENLKEIGIRNFDVVVVSIGDDLEASILVTMLLKEMGVKHVIAKAGSEVHSKVLQKVGADRVVFPEWDMGTRVAHNLVASNILDYIELSQDYTIVELKPPRRMVNKSLGDLHLRARHGINVVALRRNEELIVSPGADDVIGPEDVLVVVGRNEYMRSFQEEE
ncbi:MAG TPA: TrkA family potassium uptake protein [Firmicutes bacterium]|jgi:trk system potassium uptake protein TrkA|nr:TrkA family potassium uptake protein [Bacillota bacterium]